MNNINVVAKDQGEAGFGANVVDGLGTEAGTGAVVGTEEVAGTEEGEAHRAGGRKAKEGCIYKIGEANWILSSKDISGSL